MRAWILPFACRRKVTELEAMMMPDGKPSLYWRYTPGPTLHGIHSAPMMNEVEQDIALRFADCRLPVVPLMLGLWRDGVKLTNKNSIYPVCVRFLNVNEYLLRYSPDQLPTADKLHTDVLGECVFFFKKMPPRSKIV